MKLRILRIIISGIFFFLFCLVFIDFHQNVSPVLTGIILFPQFGPSLLSFVTFPAVSALGFVFVILLTLVFGRLYCSMICPLGFIQDICYRFRSLFKKRKLPYSKPLNYWRYGILVIVALSFIAGFALVLDMLEPFSISGRFMSFAVYPVLAWLNNLFSSLLFSMDIYSVRPVSYTLNSPASVLVSLLLFFAIAGLSVFRGRLFCNLLCPVGAILSLVSRKPLYRIRMDDSLCNSCGKCERACKAQCIDSRNKTVDASRCVMCFDCLESCPNGGLAYGLAKASAKAEAPGLSQGRRKMLLSLPAVFGSTVLLGAPPKRRHLHLGQGNRDVGPVSPPGSVSIERFNECCTACHLCIAACPTNVLQASFLHYGLKGMLQPYMDYKVNYCNYDCRRCGEVCPTGAIQLLDKELKKRTQIGKARFIRKFCVVHTDGTDCGACSEHCPTKAVDMVPYRGGLFIPEVDESICIGCGACEHACPTDPKAIFVIPNEVHQIAELPEIKEELKEIDLKEDFPF